MNELFKLFGTIAIKNDDANKAIDDTTGKAESAGSKFGNALTKIGGTAVKIGATAAASIGVVASGIGVMAKKSLDAYADYEQLVGGIETLFGAGGKSLEEYAESVGKTVDECSDEYNALIEAQEYALRRAANAYETAGLSQNQYMETVTSFSASLIASLEGDTVKAAKVADQAIIDMSDNANKMGTSMESIQNAYQGFAKQNYTMLDNLKLGYGGTKEEMARLLADATKLSGVEYDLSSFADITEAIHVIQNELGITGTTAKEASSTISGSIGQMKGAWENFLTTMTGSSDEVFYENMYALVDSVVTVAKNIAPRLIEIVPKLVEGLIMVIEELIPYIAPMIEELLPPLLEGAARLIVYLIQNLPSLIMSLGSALWDALKQMFSEISQMLPEEATNSFSAISEGFAFVWDVCKTLWESVGKPIFDMIINIVLITKEWFEENFGSIGEIAQNTFQGIAQFWEEHLKPCFEAIGQFIQNVLAPAFERVFKGYVLPLVKQTFDQIGDFWNNVLKPILTGIIDFLTGVFSGDWEKAFQGIISIAKGLLNGIIRIFEAPFNTAKNIVNNAINYIKSLFNFEWKLPPLKLPHFRVSGEFSLNPLSVPSFGIDWYAKAMDDPMIMDSPTAFGINSLGQIMAGGEKGSEVVSGTDTLMNMISQAVANKNERLEELVMAILNYLPQLAKMQIVMDSGALVGELAPGMDAALGSLALANERGI